MRHNDRRHCPSRTDKAFRLYHAGPAFTVVLLLVTVFSGSAAALDINSSQPLQYYSDGDLDFEVGVDGVITASNNLSMGTATNNITDFFDTTACATDQFVTRLYANGSYQCTDASSIDTTVADDQNLSEVLTQGNVANQSIDMRGHSISGTSGSIDFNVGSSGFRLATGGSGNGVINLRDTANNQVLLNAHEGGNVEIPNGNLDMGSNEVQDVVSNSADDAVNKSYVDSNTEADTNTDASTKCTGTTTYLDGENNCDDISSTYLDEGSGQVGNALTWDSTNNEIDVFEGGINHGNLAGLGNDDHTQYLERDGSDVMTGELTTAGQSFWDLRVDSVNANPNQGLLIENDADAGQNDTALEIRASGSGSGTTISETMFLVDAGHRTVGIGEYGQGGMSNYPDDKLDVKGNIDINSNNLEGVNNIYSSSDGTTDFFGDCGGSGSYVHSISSDGSVTCASDDFEANTDSQSLGYNNLNAPPGEYVAHEVTIGGGSNTNIRDYFNPNQSLSTTADVSGTNDQVSIGGGNSVTIDDDYEADTNTQLDDEAATSTVNINGNAVDSVQSMRFGNTEFGNLGANEARLAWDNSEGLKFYWNGAWRQIYSQGPTTTSPHHDNLRGVSYNDHHGVGQGIQWDGSNNIALNANDLDADGNLGQVDVDQANTGFAIDGTDVRMRLNDNSGQFRFVPYNTSSNNFFWSDRLHYDVSQRHWMIRTNLNMGGSKVANAAQYETDKGLTLGSCGGDNCIDANNDLHLNHNNGNNVQIGDNGGNLAMNGQDVNNIDDIIGSTSATDIFSSGGGRVLLRAQGSGGQLGWYDDNNNRWVQEYNNGGNLLLDPVGSVKLENAKLNVNGNQLDNVQDIEMDGDIHGSGVDMSLQEVGSVLGPRNGDTDLNIRTQGGGSHVVSIEDGSSSQDIARFNEGTQNVEIPNGNLDMQGNNITNCNYINSVDCSNLGGGGSGTDDQNLSEVLVQGNVANQTIEFSNGIEIGDENTTVGSNSDAVAVGKAANASGTRASAVGYDALASGDYASGVGHDAYATGEYASAFGTVAAAAGDQASAFGYHTSASANGAVAIGYNAYASAGAAMAFGTSADASGTQAVAFGSYTSASGTRASAFGNNADASAEGAVAIGYLSKAPNSYEATFGNLNGEELDVNVTGNLTVHENLEVYGGTKNFVQQVNESHEVVYTSSESSEAVVEWSNVTTVDDDGTRIAFPPHLDLVMSDTEDFHVYATPVGSLADVGVFNKTDTGFTLKASSPTQVDFHLRGVRKGYEDKPVVRRRK